MPSLCPPQPFPASCPSFVSAAFWVIAQDPFFSSLIILSAVSDVLSTVMFSVSNKNLAFEIIKDFEEAYNTDISVSWIRETDTEFKLASLEATQTIYEAIVKETVMDSLENIILLEEPQ